MSGIIYYLISGEWHFPTQHDSFRDPYKLAHALISETFLLPNVLAPEVLDEGLYSCLLPRSWDGRSWDAWCETSIYSVWYKCNALLPTWHSPNSAAPSSVFTAICLTFCAWITPHCVFLLGFLNLSSNLQSDFPSLGSSFPWDCTWLPVSHNIDAGQHADTKLGAQVSACAQSSRVLELDPESSLKSLWVWILIIRVDFGVNKIKL